MNEATFILRRNARQLARSHSQQNRGAMFMQATTSKTSSISTSKPAFWTGTVLSTLAILFLTFDGVFKLISPAPAPVVDTFALLEVPLRLAPVIGALLLVCVAIYAIPRTALLGAILLTGFLGGALSIQLRIDAPLFSIVFPLLLGIFVWGGLYLREPRLAALLPLRS
jgi:hypothetical protein